MSARSSPNLTITPPSSPAASEPDAPWLTDPEWQWLSAAEQRAYHYADTGNVCIGPVGMPVSGLDRLILRVIQEEVPDVMDDWFERSCEGRFYSVKLHVTADATEAQGPRYVLFRSLLGPVLRSSWTEVARLVVGVPGSLYQKCSSFMEASLRLSQAWMMGGVIYKIPLPSNMCAQSTALWLQAFAACDRRIYLRFDEEDLPDVLGRPYCTPEGVDEVLDVDLVKHGWHTFLPGEKPVREQHSGLLGSLPPLVAVTKAGGRSGDAGGSVTTNLTSHRRGHIPPPAPSNPIHEGNLARHPSSGLYTSTAPASGTEAGIGGYFAVIQGQYPWVFACDRDRIEDWLPAEGTGHVGHYHTLREALEAFRQGLRTGELHN